MHEKIYFDGNIEGNVSNIKGENIELHFDKSTYLMGDIALRGLPDFENTFIFFDVEDFKTTAEGLRSIPYPPFKEGKKLKVF